MLVEEGGGGGDCDCDCESTIGIAPAVSTTTMSALALGNLFPGDGFLSMNTLSKPFAEAGVSHLIAHAHRRETAYAGVAAAVLRPYFQVNSACVARRLQLVLFPYAHKGGWARRCGHGPDSAFALPRDDINAPDLYIPAMGFATYLVLRAVACGFVGRFTPDVFGATAALGIMIVVLECAIIALGGYLLGMPVPAVLDVLAIVGNVFVGADAALVALVTLGRGAYHVMACVAGVGMGVFVFNTLHATLTLRPPLLAQTRAVVRESATNLSVHRHFLFGTGVMQLFGVWCLTLRAQA